nr:amidohydrolase family protein [Luteimonas sp. XNQY3]
MHTEDSGRILDAIDELLQIDAHVHVSHLKIVAGRDAAEARAVLARLDAARADGRRVTGDVYPYLASASSLYFLYPEWAKTREQYEDAVANRRAALEAHIRRRVESRNGPEAILFTAGPHAGRRLSDVAREAGLPFERAAIDVIGYGGPPQAHFLMAQDVHDVLVRAEHVGIGTDGAPGGAHPRAAGTFVKMLEAHVGAPPKLLLDQAIHKMTGLPAGILGIDRGLLQAGRKADIVVFDLDRLDSRATYLEPMLRPAGIDLVVVNGEVALEDGTPLERRSGHMLRRLAR